MKIRKNLIPETLSGAISYMEFAISENYAHEIEEELYSENTQKKYKELVSCFEDIPFHHINPDGKYHLGFDIYWEVNNLHLKNNITNKTPKDKIPGIQIFLDFMKYYGFDYETAVLACDIAKVDFDMYNLVKSWCENFASTCNHSWWALSDSLKKDIKKSVSDYSEFIHMYSIGAETIGNSSCLYLNTPNSDYSICSDTSFLKEKIKEFYNNLPNDIKVNPVV